MIVYDVAMKVLDRVIPSAHYHWPDLWHYICFVQSGEAFTVERNKYTHTHTHTHTHTRMYQFTEKIESYEQANFSAISEA